MSPGANDHVIHCTKCGSDTGIVKDCPCLTPVHYLTCWACRAEYEYEATERARNANY